ncbi:CHASE2 domain-containing protein [candidate division KSB3 bacterium]|uniref:CHASE2 domain-containing protein n=1 Tax=candidate division KSB3 bacterium TaxID=2044937 RepID=A0A9D5Q6U6_9BACT|nr:CHASE2 domain-containing protein [candidate division KSB3 bacterium]MBD3325738.1 CHASE2 domain-containing protein [candidate division KSB3 bacterium]
MKRFLAFVLGILSAVIVWGALLTDIPYVSEFIQTVELQSIDYRMKFSPQPDIAEEVKIVLVKDVNNLSGKLAAFLNLVSSAGQGAFTPKVIGFNYRFDASVDEELVTVASMMNNVYYGYFFLFNPETPEPQADNQDILPFRLEITDISDGTSKVLEAQQVQLPAHKYLTTTRGIGFVNTLPDPDGVYRRIPLFLKYQGNWYGSLALLIAMEYMDVESVDITFYPGQYVEIMKDDGGMIRIPVNNYGEMLINFAYNPDAGGVAPFETLSMEEILAQSPLRQPSADSPLLKLKDAVVLVGSEESHPIALTSSYPLIGIHANAISTMLTHEFINDLRADLKFGLIVLVGMIAGLLLAVRRFWSQLLLALVLIGLYGGVAYGLFYQFSILLPIMQPVLTIGLTLCSVAILVRQKRPAPDTGTSQPSPAKVKERKRKAKPSSDELTTLESDLLDIREELDRKSLRLRSKVEELRLLQEQVESNHYDYSRQVASLQKEIRAREIEIKSLIGKEEELRRNLENLPFTDTDFVQIKHDHEKIAQLFATYRFMTHDEYILRTLNRAKNLSKTSVSLLIQGEPGTGRKLLAEIIKELSPRHNRPSLQVICAGDMDLLEIDLFGHRKGAFPGADEARSGFFRKVDGGTLILEEIGNLSLEIQTRLIQTVRGKALRPIGDDQAYPIDVRTIATTSQNLKELVAAGKFREDLYQYFSVFPLFLPPLRDRKEDIPALVHHFITTYNHVHSKIVETVSDAAMHLLLRHQWPGNVAELEKVIERAIAEVNPGEGELSERNISFEEADLTSEISDPGLLHYLIALLDNSRELPAYQPFREKVLAEIQRLYCIRLLREHNGDAKSAAIYAGLKGETFKKMLTELMVEPEDYRY